MTDIIEARARAIAKLVAVSPEHAEIVARATLAADRAAGYWLAPMEPDEAMLKAAVADEDALQFTPRQKERLKINFNVMRDAFLRDACKEDNDANG